MSTSLGATAPARHRLRGQGAFAWFNRDWLRSPWAPALVWLLAGVLQYVMLGWLRPELPEDWFGWALTKWDTQWYVDAATNGYPETYQPRVDDVPVPNTLAFFPLYPLLVRLVAILTPGSITTGALVTSWVCGLAAAVVLHRLLLRLHSPGMATAMTWLVFTQPMAVVWWMGYTESLFLLLACAALLFAHQERWLLAGLMSFLAGLTRTTGVAVAFGLGVAALMWLWRHRRADWRVIAAPVIGVLGVPAYVGWVGHRVGEADGWFKIQQAGWDTAWDNGAQTREFISRSLREGGQWVEIAVAWLLIALTVLYVVALFHRTWPPLAAYAGGILVLTLGQTNFYHSKPRLLIPAVATLLPLGAALSRGHRGLTWGGLALWGLFGTWFGAYMVEVWRFAI